MRRVANPLYIDENLGYEDHFVDAGLCEATPEEVTLRHTYIIGCPI